MYLNKKPSGKKYFFNDKFLYSTYFFVNYHSIICSCCYLPDKTLSITFIVILNKFYVGNVLQKWRVIMNQKKNDIKNRTSCYLMA